MDKYGVEPSTAHGLPARLTTKLKTRIAFFNQVVLRLRLPLATQIALQYLLIVCLWLLLVHLLSFLIPGISFFATSAELKNVFFVIVSTLLIYFLLRRALLPSPTSIPKQAEVAELDRRQQVYQHLEARTDELSRLLNVSQGINAKLEGLLADQTAIAIENERLHEEAGQTAILEERQRLGRDLHDSVTQALYSMVLFADATRLALAAGKQVEASENLNQVRIMARQAMADMRLLIYQLHPPLLKKEGLAATLQTRLEAVESRAGLRTEFRTEGSCDLPPMIESELYRIAQEVLNNVIKHAKAERVTLELICSDSFFCMTITDDGIGFDISHAQEKGGVGLRSIAERAKQINALLILESRPHHGTKVQVKV